MNYGEWKRSVMLGNENPQNNPYIEELRQKMFSQKVMTELNRAEEASDLRVVEVK